MVKTPYIEFIKADVGYPQGGGGLPVINNLNLKFNCGELTAIVGLNGTGKSTLLRSMAGLQDLISGRLNIESNSIRNYSKQQLAKKISIVLTDRIGGFNLTVREIIESGQMPYTGMFHHLNSQQKQIAELSAQRCGVSTFINKPLHELSDGMFQKTMIAKAICQQTSALLLDEPTAYLDYASRHQLFMLLKDLAENDGKCVVLSSHDLDLAMKYCHRLVLIDSFEARSLLPSEAREDVSFVNMTGGYL